LSLLGMLSESQQPLHDRFAQTFVTRD
jgi:hypothetical protein